MAMKPLDPIPEVTLEGGWTLLATDAGRSVRGVAVTAILRNGDTRAAQTLRLSNAVERQAVVRTFAASTHLDEATLEGALLRLWEGVEGSLRRHEGRKGPTQATYLVEMALKAGAQLFHTPEGEAYATIEIDGHQETWSLKVKAFRMWLARLFYVAEEKAPGAQAIQDALGVLTGQALFDGPESSIFTRLAEHEGTIYLDLTNASWQAVEITAAGWRVVPTPSVKFRRARGMLPLPVPEQGGSLDTLRPFVNIASEADWCLLVSWLLAALRPTGPYTVLVLHGEQGSAKSTLVRILRALVDPNTADTRAIPRDERDLVIAATNGWMVALDNLSHLPDWLSDALCRLTTGGGFATRELYTDAEEVIFQAQRPIVINGIEELVTRSDLLDRALMLYLPTIPEKHRQDEHTFWLHFEQAKARILGVLLDAVSTALQTIPSVQREGLPRMADFCAWACAAASACGWTAEDVLEAYTGNRQDAHALALDASPVPAPLRHLLSIHEGMWESPAAELLDALERLDCADTRHKSWPGIPRALSSILRRLAPNLRAVGVEVTLWREPGGQRRRLITLRTTVQDRETTEEGGRDGRDDRDAKIHDYSVDAKNPSVEDASASGEKNVS